MIIGIRAEWKSCYEYAAHYLLIRYIFKLMAIQRLKELHGLCNVNLLLL